MEEVKKVLLLLLGCAVQVGAGLGMEGARPGPPVCAFVGTERP